MSYQQPTGQPNSEHPNSEHPSSAPSAQQAAPQAVQQPVQPQLPPQPAPFQSPVQSPAPAGKRRSVLGAWGARIVLIVVAACALVSVVFILFGAGGDTLGRVVTTDIALIVFALLVWLDTVIGAYRDEWFEFTSLATDAYLLLLWITTVWTETDTGPFALWIDIWRCFLSLLFVRAMLALVDVVQILYSRWITTVTRSLAYVSAVAIGLIAVLVTIPSPAPFNGLWDAEYYGRVIAALAVIAGVALVLIPLWGLLINRSHGVRRTPAAPYPAYGAPYGYGQQPVAGYGHQGYQQGGYQHSGYEQPGYPQPATPSAPPVPPAPAAPASQAAPAAPPVPTPDPVSATAHASQPALAWPLLRDGRPVPAGHDGAPDFAAIAGQPLAWPSFADGRPVPAGSDGRPLYT